jgi:hypothetical protein
MKAAGLGLALLGTSAIAQEEAGQNQCNRAELVQLETEARELVVAEGCTDVSQCRAAPVGVQACGGPRDYVVYCSAATDENALLRALKRLEQREERFNRQCDVVSICVFLLEPQLELVNGVCQEAAPPPDTLP